ncbi:Uncharacterised protein [uncultured Clostridium sp.]|jgi:hypothetical protein|nr:Uncharacterised protein [uncultured Clostridium sp.]DAF33019.1 MAG TPA: immunity protein [Caudoviricetes sp.]
MMDFMKACDLARNIFVKRDYKDGLCEIFDSGDRWIFFGRIFEEGVVEYGNCPVTVDKETGQCEDFPISDIQNYDLYYESKPIKVPSEYVIKD